MSFQGDNSKYQLQNYNNKTQESGFKIQYILHIVKAAIKELLYISSVKKYIFLMIY